MQIGREKISGRNLDELSECSLAGESEKTRKITIPSPVLSFDLLVSVKENTDQKKKEKQKKIKIRIEHKPNWTCLTLCIMLKYYPNN